MIEAQTRTLKYVSPNSLKPDPRNPRKHDRAQIRAIARSVETFGFNAPILIDRNNCVLAGHGRLAAAKLLELTHVPTITLDDLSEDQARAYMLADNKLSERSRWDEEILGSHLKELALLSLDFEIEATGFEPAEIDYHVQSLDEKDVTDSLDEFTIMNAPPVSRLGDLWCLDGHRIYCGNALEPTIYQQLLGHEKVAAVFTDPPYNVKIAGNVSGLGKITHRDFAMASGEMSPADFTEFLSTVFRLTRHHMVPGAIAYTCMDWRHLNEILFASKKADFEILNLCIWVKSNGGMGSFYRSRHELVFVFKSGAAPHRNNVQLGQFGRNRSNVWNYAGASSFARKGQTRGTELHPTMKPVALVADALLDSTVQTDIVFDPFLGSGTTLLAAERTQRRCYSIELDPIYVDTAIRRWESMTGKQAHLASGQAFHEVADDRRA